MSKKNMLCVLIAVVVLALLGAFLPGCAPPGTMPTVCQQWYDRGRLDGNTEGYAKGVQDGKAMGYTDGYSKGLADGKGSCPSCPQCPQCPPQYQTPYYYYQYPYPYPYYRYRIYPYVIP